MKILFLYNNACVAELREWLKRQGNDVTASQTRLDKEWCERQCFDLTVSYTYRYILSAEIIHVLNNNVVNLHNSFLPWNRGADPNMWSIVDGTPHGVTLHYINVGLDKGNIIAQKLVPYSGDETFESSYQNLDRAAKELFKEAFHYYSYWPDMQKTAVGKGSYHSVKDGAEIKNKIGPYVTKISDYLSRGGNVLTRHYAGAVKRQVDAA